MGIQEEEVQQKGRLPYPRTYPECYLRARTDDGLELIVDMSPRQPRVQQVIDNETGYEYFWDIYGERTVYDDKRTDKPRPMANDEENPFPF